MTRPIRKALIIAALFLGLLAPNLILVDQSWPHRLAATTISLLLLLWPVWLVKNWRSFFLLNLPLFAIGLLLGAYQIYYRGVVTPGLMQSLFEANWVELVEKSTQWWWVLVVFVVALAIYGVAAWTLRGQTIVRRRLCMALFCWGLLLAIYQPYLGFEIYRQWEVNLDLRPIRAAYPANLYFSISDAIADLKNRKHAVKTLPPVRSLPNRPPRLFVTVIGESTRGQSFSEVATRTGFLADHPKIAYFADTLAQANFTDASIPMLLSGAHTLDEVAHKPYLIAWQNAAHCLTAALSNSNTYDFLEDAKIRDIAGNSGIVHLGRYDHDLLAIFDSLIKMHPEENLCITLQMVGSHVDYNVRYRPPFALYPVPQQDERARLTAEYNNTVVMVQDFIAQLATRIDDWNGPAFLAYTSDHGENLLEINGLREHVTSTPTIYELAVPMLFYGNTAFLQDFAGQWEQLEKNAALPVSNANFLPTILEALDIDAPEEFLAGSLFRPFVPEERRFTRPDFRIASENELLRP